MELTSRAVSVRKGLQLTPFFEGWGLRGTQGKVMTLRYLLSQEVCVTKTKKNAAPRITENFFFFPDLKLRTKMWENEIVQTNWTNFT